MRRFGRLAAASLLWPTAASAHDGSVAGGFLAGFSHPLTGPDHLLAMVAVGIWGAVLGRPLLVALPITFPVMMAVGGLIGIAGLPFPPVEIGVALSVLMLGAAIAAQWRAPVPVAILLVAIFALFHGYAHGRELPAAADPLYYSLGFMVTTGMLHLIGIAIGTFHTLPRGRWATRGIGALVALCGVGFLLAAVA